MLALYPLHLWTLFVNDLEIMKSAFCLFILPIVLRYDTLEPILKKDYIPNVVAFGKSCQMGSTRHSNVFDL